MICYAVRGAGRGDAMRYGSYLLFYSTLCLLCFTLSSAVLDPLSSRSSALCSIVSHVSPPFLPPTDVTTSIVFESASSLDGMHGFPKSRTYFCKQTYPVSFEFPRNQGLFALALLETHSPAFPARMAVSDSRMPPPTMDRDGRRWRGVHVRAEHRAPTDTSHEGVYDMLVDLNGRVPRGAGKAQAVPHHRPGHDWLRSSRTHPSRRRGIQCARLAQRH